MTTNQFINQIRELIARDDLETALKQLRVLLENSPKLDEVLHQSGRFENIRKQIRLGTVSHAEATLTQDQIRAALLELISEVVHSVEGTSGHPDMNVLHAEVERAISIVQSKNVVVDSTITVGSGNVHIGDTTTITESQTSRRLRLFLFLFVPLLTLSAAYLWYNLQAVSLTVVTRQPQPIPDLPFQKGNLVLYHGGKPDTKTIETEVIFTDINRGELVSLHFDTPGFDAVDTSFSVSGNQIFQLPVRRDSSLMRIAGTIKDMKGNPVAGCQVQVAGMSTMSDATGRYDLKVPYLQQRSLQVIRAVKDGREGFNETRTIVSNEDNDIIFQTQ